MIYKISEHALGDTESAEETDFTRLNILSLILGQSG